MASSGEDWRLQTAETYPEFLQSSLFRFFPGAELSAEVSSSPKQTDLMFQTGKNTELSSLTLQITVLPTLFGTSQMGSSPSVC